MRRTSAASNSGFLLGGYEVPPRRPFKPLRLADPVGQVVLPVVAVGEARFRCRLVPETGILLPEPLHQRPVAQVLEPAAPVGHGRLKNLLSDGQQNVARRHAAELAARLEIRRLHLLRKVDRCRPVDPDSPLAQNPGEIVEKFVPPVDGLLRPHSMLPAHVGIRRDLCIQCRFRRRDVATGLPCRQ